MSIVCHETLLFIGLLAGNLLSCRAFSSGAPGCGINMASALNPAHGTQNNDSLPLNMNVNQQDNNWTVSLEATSGFFRGFLLRVEPVLSGEPVRGQFISIPNNSKTCGETDVTHSNNNDRTSLEFVWSPAQNYTGEVYFRATMVITKDLDYKTLSSQPISTSTSSSTPSSITSHNSVSQILPDPECGSSKGCVSSCTGSSCSYQITWQRRGDVVRFEMMLRTGGNQYQAIGFSDDDKMGADSVMMCKSGTGSVSFEVGYNTGTSYSPISNVTDILVIESSQNGNKASCIVDRTINSSHAQVYSLTRSWFLLRASGSVSGSTPNIHSEKEASEGTVDFLTASLVTLSESSSLLIKVHGSIMIIAWVLFSSVGLVAARHYKDRWDGKEFAGLKIWFQIHRTCMVLVFLCTITAFVIIFVHVGGYREISVVDNREYLKSHPVLGIIVTCLTVINPIMSIFRNKQRSVFNIAHFLVGTVAHSLAAITILFGMNLDQSDVPEEASYIMYAYMGVFILIEIILETSKHCKERKSQDNTIEMKNTGNTQETNITFGKQGMKKELFLYAHIILMAGFCLAMLILVLKA